MEKKIYAMLILCILWLVAVIVAIPVLNWLLSQGENGEFTIKNVIGLILTIAVGLIAEKILKK